MDIKHVKLRIVKSKVIQIIIIALAFLITLPLLFIIYYIFKRGITRINWTFLTHIPKPVGETGGGIVNALAGSIIIVLVAAIIAGILLKWLAVPVVFILYIILSLAFKNKTT